MKLAGIIIKTDASHLFFNSINRLSNPLSILKFSSTAALLEPYLKKQTLITAWKVSTSNTYTFYILILLPETRAQAFSIKWITLSISISFKISDTFDNKFLKPSWPRSRVGQFLPGIYLKIFSARIEWRDRVGWFLSCLLEYEIA